MRSVLFSCSSFLWWPECNDSCSALKGNNKNSLPLWESNRVMDNTLGERRAIWDAKAQQPCSSCCLILFRIQYNQGWQPPTTASRHELGSLEAKPSNSTSYWILFRSGTMGREKWAGKGRESLLRGNLLPDRHSWGFPGGSAVKNLLAMQETWVWSLGQEDPLEEGMATHSSLLAWRIPTDRGAWRATVHGVAQSWTRLKRLSSSSSRGSWPRGWPVFLPWTWLYKAVMFRAETVFWWWWDARSQDENPNCWGWTQRKKLSPGWHHWAAAWSLKISAVDFLFYGLLKSLGAEATIRYSIKDKWKHSCGTRTVTGTRQLG